jgi:ketosteroid isomerase-like protein
MAGAGTEHGAQTRGERLVAPYLDYVNAFNAADLHAVARHLAEDVVFDWGDVMPALVGRQAFLDFYGRAWQHFDEELTVSGIRTEGNMLSAHISTGIKVHTDWADCPIRPMYAGAHFTVSGRMTYRFHRARICHIAEVDHSSNTTP